MGVRKFLQIPSLTKEEQKDVLDAMEYTQAAPSLSQAQRIHQLSREGEFTREAVREILSEVKKGDIRRVAFKNDQLHHFFPKEFSPQRMKSEILEILTERMEPEGQHKESKESKESKVSEKSNEPEGGITDV